MKVVWSYKVGLLIWLTCSTFEDNSYEGKEIAFQAKSGRTINVEDTIEKYYM